jgi:hypothetical protein
MRVNFNRVKLKCEALLAQRVDDLHQEVKRLRGRYRRYADPNAACCVAEYVQECKRGATASWL